MRLFEDTTPEAQEAYLSLLAAASPARKGRMLSGLYRTAMEAATAGARTRHPDASPAEIRAAVARLMLGDSLAERFLARAVGGSRAVSR